MDPNDKVEKLISTTIDNLPLPFMIFGKKKEVNPLEDFWMAKLETIEKQYNEHIVKLERSLLENRISKRHLVRKDERITRLKGDLNEKSTELLHLQNQTDRLEKKLSNKQYKTDSLKKRLTSTEQVKSKVLKSLEDERHGRIQREKEVATLRLKLTHLERDKKFLSHEISIKNSEKGRVEEREANLAQNKWTLIKSLTEIDQERRVQTSANVQLVETMEELLDVGKSQEFKLLKQRKEIDMILEGMKEQRKEHEYALRKLGIGEKEVKDLLGQKKFSAEKVQHLERQVRDWKEEFEFKDLQNTHSGLEMKDLKRENSNLRCQLAEYRERLTRNANEMKSLESEKRRTEIELQKAKGQARSIYLVTCRNELMKQKLADKILKSHPSIKTRLEERAGGTRMNFNQGYRVDEKGEIESYKKKVVELERQKGELERSILESKRKQSRLKLKLDKYSGMEVQILWTEKAMVKLDGDRNRMDYLLKTMAWNVPKKIPFQKLVTDPSVLDRMAKYQILQKRLLLQSTKVQELQRNAVKIMEYRKRKSEEEFANKRGQLSPWRLSHWKQSSEDTLADLDNQLELEPDGTVLSERKYYKDYISYLDTEIPSVKQQIALLERRQQYRQQQLLDTEKNSQRKQQDNEDLENGSFDSVAILPKLSSTDIPLETVPEDGENEESGVEAEDEDEEEEEDDDDDEEGVGNEDSDIDGLLRVVSIDEPSSELRQESQATGGRDEKVLSGDLENDNEGIVGAEQMSGSDYEDENEVNGRGTSEEMPEQPEHDIQQYSQVNGDE